MTDPVDLTAALIRCPSVTPEEGGAIRLLERMLAAAGFRTARADRNGIANLYARWGTAGPVLGFNGHTDVVPPGDPAAWRHPPFAAAIEDGRLYGRGAADMKSGVAAFVAAAIDFVAATPPAGSIVITITGDEEGDGADGTRAILDWMAANGERIDHCLVGEPTCPARMGEMIKIGRRGSLTARLTAYGPQGHTAYPDRAKNPLPALVRLLDRLAAHAARRGHRAFRPLDAGDHHHRRRQPGRRTSSPPRRARRSTSASTTPTPARRSRDWIEEEADRAAREFGIGIAARFQISGESFLTAPGPFTDLVARAVAAETGVDARALHLRRHLRRALHQGPLPGGRVRPRRRHHAPGRRARGDRPHPRAEGGLRPHPRRLLRRADQPINQERNFIAQIQL